MRYLFFADNLSDSIFLKTNTLIMYVFRLVTRKLVLLFLIIYLRLRGHFKVLMASILIFGIIITVIRRFNVLLGLLLL